MELKSNEDESRVEGREKSWIWCSPASQAHKTSIKQLESELRWESKQCPGCETELATRGRGENQDLTPSNKEETGTRLHYILKLETIHLYSQKNSPIVNSQ